MEKKINEPKKEGGGVPELKKNWNPNIFAY